MKEGYNFKYKFAEQTSKAGTPAVAILEEIWYVSRNRGSVQVIGGYPYGNRREDVVVDQVLELFEAFAEVARESGVTVRQAFGRWNQARWVAEDCTMASAVVQGLVEALKRLNRVSVEVQACDVKND